MRFAWLVFGALLPTLALAQAQEEGRTSRRTSSQSQRYSVQFTQGAAGKCTLEVQQDREKVWSWDTCVGTAEDLYFVSDKGDRVWVLHVFPEVVSNPKVKKARADPVWDTVVAELFDRTGQRVSSRRLRDLVTGATRDPVQEFGRHFKWVGGAMGVSGLPPHVREGNRLELEPNAAKPVQLDF